MEPASGLVTAAAALKLKREDIKKAYETMRVIQPVFVAGVS
jgi:hypothetical protein